LVSCSKDLSTTAARACFPTSTSAISLIAGMFVHYQLNKKKIEGKDRRTVEAYLNKLSFGDHYNFSTDIHIYSFSFLLCFQKKQ